MRKLGDDYCGPGCRGLCPCPIFKPKVDPQIEKMVRRAIEYDPEKQSSLSDFWKDLRFDRRLGEWVRDAKSS